MNATHITWPVAFQYLKKPLKFLCIDFISKILAIENQGKNIYVKSQSYYFKKVEQRDMVTLIMIAFVIAYSNLKTLCIDVHMIYVCTHTFIYLKCFKLQITKNPKSKMAEAVGNVVSYVTLGAGVRQP